MHYLLAFLLLTVWAIGYTVLNAGNPIHILLALAVITIVLYRSKPNKS